MTLAAITSRPAAEPLLRSRQLAPSILAADPARLADELGPLLDAGARVVHVDVMDGRFVPPITMGAGTVEALSELVHGSGGILDVHLMIAEPERQLAAFAAAGADILTVHVEACPHVHRTLHEIRELGCRAGVAINPGTPVDAVAAVLDTADLVLVMSVDPGWGGQRFLEAAPERIARLRELAPPGVAIEVDGGIGVETVAACADAGAGLLVAGSALFGADDPIAAYHELAAAIAAG